MFKRTCITLISTIVLATAAQAHDFTFGGIHIAHPFARATMPKQSAGSVYFDLENNGKTDDKLVKVNINHGIAKSAEIHSMEMVGDVMKMREVSQIDLKAGDKVAMKPGSGLHIMLIGLTHQLKPMETFPMTLHFEKGGKIDVVVNVEASDSDGNVDHQEHKH